MILNLFILYNKVKELESHDRMSLLPRWCICKIYQPAWWFPFHFFTIDCLNHRAALLNRKCVLLIIIGKLQ